LFDSISHANCRDFFADLMILKFSSDVPLAAGLASACAAFLLIEAAPRQSYAPRNPVAAFRPSTPRSRTRCALI
jgi:hypothetical protein